MPNNLSDKIMIFLTLIIAVASVWSSWRTSSLVENQIITNQKQIDLINYQLNPQLYFSLRSYDYHLLPNVISEGIQYISFSSFIEYPLLKAELINLGLKPIKIKGVSMYGSCLKNTNRQNLLSISPSEEGIYLEPSAQLIFDVPQRNNWNGRIDEEAKLPCDITVILFSDEFEKEAKVILVENTNNYTGFRNIF